MSLIQMQPLQSWAFIILLLVALGSLMMTLAQGNQEQQDLVHERLVQQDNGIFDTEGHAHASTGFVSVDCQEGSHNAACCDGCACLCHEEAAPFDQERE